jgi:hypothetical protein
LVGFGVYRFAHISRQSLQAISRIRAALVQPLQACIVPPALLFLFLGLRSVIPKALRLIPRIGTKATSVIIQW